MNLLQTVLQHGGVALWLIAAGSVLSVGLALERFVFSLGFKASAASVHAGVMAAIGRGDLEAARAAAGANVPAARVYRAALEAKAAGRPVGTAADRERRRVALLLRKGLWLQGTLGATMPFIGLYGTVVGVLESFGNIAKAGTGGFAVVSGSIAEALVTTAAGIAVAVVAVLLYNVFGAGAQARSTELTLNTEEFVEALESRAPGAP